MKIKKTLIENIVIDTIGNFKKAEETYYDCCKIIENCEGQSCKTCPFAYSNIDTTIEFLKKPEPVDKKEKYTFICNNCKYAPCTIEIGTKGRAPHNCVMNGREIKWEYIN